MGPRSMLTSGHFAGISAGRQYESTRNVSITLKNYPWSSAVIRKNKAFLPPGTEFAICTFVLDSHSYSLHSLS